MLIDRIQSSTLGLQPLCLLDDVWLMGQIVAGDGLMWFYKTRQLVWIILKVPQLRHNLKWSSLCVFSGWPASWRSGPSLNWPSASVNSPLCSCWWLLASSSSCRQRWNMFRLQEVLLVLHKTLSRSSSWQHFSCVLLFRGPDWSSSTVLKRRLFSFSRHSIRLWVLWFTSSLRVCRPVAQTHISITWRSWGCRTDSTKDDFQSVGWIWHQRAKCL